MTNIFPIIRKTGRLTCAWVPTGNAKSPLACVWTEVEPSHASPTTDTSANTEAGGMRLCA
jgi:hypothetical protein